jgi:hypothetical protein
MRTTLYAQVLQQAAEIAGRAYTDDAGAVVLSGSDAIMFRTMIGQAIRRAWTAQAWPETTVHTLRRWAAPWTMPKGITAPAEGVYLAGSIVWWPTTEQYYVAVRDVLGIPPTYESGGTQIGIVARWQPALRSYSGPDWSSSETYQVGDVVRYLYDGNHYALHTSTVAGTKPTNTGYWGRLVQLDQRVAWDQAWEDQTLGDPYGVYLDDPLKTEEPREATYTWDEDGIRVLDRVTGVYLHSWTPEPQFLTDPATVPARFAQYAAMVGAGFMLRSEGKTDQGNELIKVAEGILADEASKITRRESRSGRMRIG